MYGLGNKIQNEYKPENNYTEMLIKIPIIVCVYKLLRKDDFRISPANRMHFTFHRASLMPPT